MDGTSFDAWTRRLTGSGSRRALLGALSAGVMAALGHDRVAARNAECAHFCNAAFPPGRERGKCKSEAALGRGPCYGCEEAPACPGQFQDPVTCACRGGDASVCDGSRCGGAACGGSQDCFCNSSVEGIGFCIRASEARCQDPAYAPCTTSADCPGGLCLNLRGCCGRRGRLCVPLSASCSAGTGGGGVAADGSDSPGWNVGRSD